MQRPAEAVSPRLDAERTATMTDTHELLILIDDYRRAVEAACEAGATAARFEHTTDDLARLRRMQAARDEATAALLAAVVRGVEPAPLRLAAAIMRRGPGITR